MRFTDIEKIDVCVGEVSVGKGASLSSNLPPQLAIA